MKREISSNSFLSQIGEYTHLWTENGSELFFTKDRVYKKYYCNDENLEKVNILRSYELAKTYSLEIHEVTEQYIVSSTPKYKYSLLQYFLEIDVDKRKDGLVKYLSKINSLIDNLRKNNLFHDDLAFRNICIDEQDNLHLIDFEELREGKQKKSDYLLLVQVINASEI